jgi:hypothetical protein
VVLVAIGISLAASLGGPLAYSLTTLNTGHAGSIVTAGPPGASMMGGGGHGGFGGPGGEGAGGPGGMRPTGSGQGGFPGQGRGQGQGQNGQGGGFGGQAPGGAGAAGQGQGRMGGAQGGFPGQGGQGGQGGQKGGGMGGGAFGGLLNGATVSSDAKSLLEKDASSYTWPAAAIGSQNAANYQLATGDPIMAIGGFNGSDPSPTLAQFQQDVADGKIHYFIAGGRGDMGARGGETAGGKGGGMGGAMGGGSRGGSNASSAISSWVEKTFKKVTVGDATFYDLTQKATS